MAELDDKLNQLLSDPNALSQIMQMAQSLMGSASGAAPPNPQAPPQGTPPPAWTPSDLFGTLGSIDPKLLTHLLPLVQELGGSSNAKQLLTAMRPYLKPTRQEKVERALQLARLFRIGKHFLAAWRE